MTNLYRCYCSIAILLLVTTGFAAPATVKTGINDRFLSHEVDFAIAKDNTTCYFISPSLPTAAAKAYYGGWPRRLRFAKPEIPSNMPRRESIAARHQSASASDANLNYNKYSIGFEENKGQITGASGVADDAVNFRFSPSKATTVFLTNTGIVYQFTRKRYIHGRTEKTRAEVAKRRVGIHIEAGPNSGVTETYRMDMTLVDASNAAAISKEGESEAFNQYFTDRAIRARGYQRVTYHEVYPGIDWVIYLNGSGGLKYDFIVHPGADPALIRMRYTDAEALSVTNAGKLTITNRLGKVVEDAPLSFQNGVSVQSAFAVEGNDVVFRLAKYNASQTLTIDPSLNWATYYGDTRDDAVYSTEVDSNGNVYIAGTTNSNNMAVGGYDNTLGSTGNTDAFLAKFNASGVLQWATYYGGTNDDMGYDCAVDDADNVILCGTTSSTASIASAGAHQTARGGNSDAFLVKFDTGGNRTWATYYGGAEVEQGISCITDSNRAVYLCGATTTQESTGGNTALATSGAHQTVLRNEAGVAALAGFLVKFNSTGVRQWGSYLGGETRVIADTDNDATAITSCAIDGNNNLYVSGLTGSKDLGLGGYYSTMNGDEDLFLAKFNSSGVLLWGTYYPDLEGNTFVATILNDGLSSFTSAIASCDVDASNNVVLCGRASLASGVASSGAYKTTAKGTGDTYIAKFTSGGTRSWATYIGGNNIEYPRGVCIDANGNIYIAGFTNSTSDLAIGGALTTYQSYAAGWVAFLVRFDKDGAYEWGTYHGGTATTVDYGLACAVNNSSNQVYLAGVANSASGIASGGHQNTKSGFTEGFLAQFKRATFLPVQLAEFTAHCQNGNAAIGWHTLTEVQNKKFILESSYDQQNWKIVAELPGAGTANQPQYYNVVDKTPSNNIRYYRLRQIDFDGRERFLQTVSLQCGGTKLKFTVFPNPANQVLHIQGLAVTTNYRLTNALGQSVKQGQISPSNAFINVAALSTGTYYLTMNTIDEHFVQKIQIK